MNLTLLRTTLRHMSAKLRGPKELFTSDWKSSVVCVTNVNLAMARKLRLERLIRRLEG